MRFALHSSQALAKISHISFSWMCELLFKFDELSNANKGHIRISRCACVNGREHIWKTRIPFKRQCVMILSHWTHPSKCLFFKWRVRESRIWIGRASVKSVVYPLCLQPTKKGHWYKKKKQNTWTCSERGLFFISPQHPSSAGGVWSGRRKPASETERERGRQA